MDGPLNYTRSNESLDPDTAGLMMLIMYYMLDQLGGKVELPSREALGLKYNRRTAVLEGKPDGTATFAFHGEASVMKN